MSIVSQYNEEIENVMREYIPIDNFFTNNRLLYKHLPPRFSAKEYSTYG